MSDLRLILWQDGTWNTGGLDEALAARDRPDWLGELAMGLVAEGARGIALTGAMRIQELQQTKRPAVLVVEDGDLALVSERPLVYSLTLSDEMLSPEELQQIQESWKELWAGAEPGRLVILPDGMTITSNNLPDKG